MTEEVVEPYGIPTIYCDGFTEHRISNGVMHCIGYREHRDPAGEIVWIAEVRLIVNVAGIGRAIEQTRDAINRQPIKGLHMIEKPSRLS